MSNLQCNKTEGDIQGHIHGLILLDCSTQNEKYDKDITGKLFYPARCWNGWKSLMFTQQIIFNTCFVSDIVLVVGAL